MKEGVSRKTKQQKKRRLAQRQNAGKHVRLKYEALDIPAPSSKSLSLEGKLLARESEELMNDLFMANITVKATPYKQNFEQMSVFLNETEL